MKTVVRILIRILIMALVVYGVLNFTGCTGSSVPETGTDDIEYTVIEETDYDDPDDYNEQMPEKVFEPSDMVGMWVNESDPTYPDVLEISKSGDTYYYEYYSYAPGNESGIGYGETYTKWEYCDSTILMNPYRGNFECDNSDRTDTYEMFFYIDENTIERVDDGEYFYRNDNFQYVNPYA